MLGICIKYFHPNYGGMLQAYATTKIFEKRKIEYELIRYKKKKDMAFYLKSIPRLFNPILLNDKYLVLSKKCASILHPKFKINEQMRKSKFKEFEKMFFSDKEKCYIGYDSLREGTVRYETVVTGSDQLWSPSGLESNFFNLMFVPDDIKKISLASSFGVNQIPRNQKKRTKQYLERIPYISMRENRGAEIVQLLTRRSVPVVLDPALMLAEEEWNKIASNDICCKEQYIFVYLLGANVEYRKMINEFARANDLKIVTLRHANQYVKQDEDFGDYCPYDVGPKEFLTLIKNAKYVCTDSYHGCIFSIIYNKQFAVFNRYNNKSVNSKNSRIDTLCANLKLGSQRYEKGTSLQKILTNPIDYDVVHTMLEQKRNQFNTYLDNALSGN